MITIVTVNAQVILLTTMVLAISIGYSQRELEAVLVLLGKLIIKILLLTENSLNKIERDETWIFRQIK